MAKDGSKALKMVMAIVQRGKADDLVAVAIRAGAPAATVFYARGQGIRERLGLLGLAIQPEKEVIITIVEEWLVDRVLAAMVKAGRLDQPGVGFAFVVAVERALGMVEAQELTKGRRPKPAARRSAAGSRRGRPASAPGR